MTPSVTLSDTPTYTSTDTGTHTVTFTASATYTPTGTPSHTGTYTVTPTITVSATPTASPTATFTGSGTITMTATRTPTFSVSHTPTVSGTISPTATFTPTLRPLEILDHRFYPNPWDGTSTAHIAVQITAPADRIVVEIYTTSYRKLCERAYENPDWGEYARLPFQGRDSLGNYLSNGVYLYKLTLMERGAVVGREMGKIVILR
jgi:hypothetical protein